MQKRHEKDPEQNYRINELPEVSAQLPRLECVHGTQRSRYLMSMGEGVWGRGQVRDRDRKTWAQIACWGATFEEKFSVLSAVF